MVRDFVNSRVIGGVQQITANIDFHTYGELVMWPYGYTCTDVPADMTQDDHDAFATLGQAMAATNGYTPRAVERPVHHRRRRSTTGCTATHRIFAYTFEMYPVDSGAGRLLPAGRGDPGRRPPATAPRSSTCSSTPTARTP